MASPPSSSTSSASPKSQPTATSDPPTSPNSPAPPLSPPIIPSSPPPSLTALPITLPTSPPPAAQPPPNPPPPIASAPPPPVVSAPPPPVASAPPPSVNSPPPTSPPTPSRTSPSTLITPASPPPPVANPPTISPPPPAANPPTISPPPPVANPPSISPPPPSLPLSPPLAPSVSPPPPVESPPTFVPLPSPAKAKPPKSSSPSPPIQDSPPPSESQTPPLAPSTSPPKSKPPSAGPKPPSSPPRNSSGSLPPTTPTVASPTTPLGPLPISPSANKSSNSSASDVGGPGDGNFGGGRGGNSTATAVAVGVVVGLLVLSLAGAAIWFLRKKKKAGSNYAGGYVMPSPLPSSQISESTYLASPTAPLMNQRVGSQGLSYSSSEAGMGNSKSWFSYQELFAITDGFSSKNLLGEGGFGCVYKGRQQDGREVAVKQLNIGGSQGEREFRAEVEIISRIHHRHLVSLVGYCIAENQRLLVYDYVPNNTLYYHLHGEGTPVMDWATRIKVAAGAARGIAYLHEDCHPRIIHRDIKSSNILLDDNFEAQVADFGLAKLAMDACTHVTTRVMGTFGYLAPEYASSGMLTDKSDVYSFGVVLLEIITGRKPVDSSQPVGDESLVEWARPLLTGVLEGGDFGELPDSRLENNYNEAELFRMIEAAAACIRHSAAKRPRMGQVVRALDSLADSDINNGILPGQSELMNTGPHSADIRLFQRMAFGGSQDFTIDFSQSSWNSRRESQTRSGQNSWNSRRDFQTRSGDQ